VTQFEDNAGTERGTKQIVVYTALVRRVHCESMVIRFVPQHAESYRLHIMAVS
jgi:hypothetical protein